MFRADSVSIAARFRPGCLVLLTRRTGRGGVAASPWCTLSTPVISSKKEATGKVNLCELLTVDEAGGSQDRLLSGAARLAERRGFRGLLGSARR